MLLMGLMSVILFFGGLLTSNDRPVPIVDNLPNEGLLRPTSLLPWESVELSETRLLSGTRKCRRSRARSA